METDIALRNEFSRCEAVGEATRRRGVAVEGFRFSGVNQEIHPLARAL
jgi:hypothetical protein